MNLPRPEVNPNYEGFTALVDRVTVRVYARAGGLMLTKANARALIIEFVREVGDLAVKNGRCAIPGLGVVYRSRSKARNVRNPVTNEPMRLSASWSLKMRASQNRKGAIAP